MALSFKRYSLCFTGILGIFFIGCSNSNSGGSSACSNSSSYVGTMTNIYSHVFSTQCVSCHTPGKSPYEDGLSQLDFSTAASAYASLTSSSTGRVSGAASGLGCQNILYVNSASPTTSYLMAVLSDDYATNNFAGMAGCIPLNSHRTGLVNLCSSDVSAISQWILNGAVNN